jgi:hypothetical protein
MIVTQEAAKAIAMQHHAELRAMSERDALIAADRLLAMAASAPFPAEKERSDGIIERQRILYRIRK